MSSIRASSDESKSTAAEKFASQISWFNVTINPQFKANSVFINHRLYVLDREKSILVFDTKNKKLRQIEDCKGVEKLVEIPGRGIASISKLDDGCHLQFWHVLSDGKLERDGKEHRITIDKAPLQISTLTASPDGRYLAAIMKNDFHLGAWIYDCHSEKENEFTLSINFDTDDDSDSDVEVSINELANKSDIYIRFVNEQRFAVVTNFGFSDARQNMVDIYDVADLETKPSCKQTFKMKIPHLCEFYPSPDGTVAVCVKEIYIRKSQYNMTWCFLDLETRKLTDDSKPLTTPSFFHSVRWQNNTAHLAWFHSKSSKYFISSHDRNSMCRQDRNINGITSRDELQDLFVLDTETVFVLKKDGSCYLDTQPMCTVERELQEYDNPVIHCMRLMRDARGISKLSPPLRNIICQYVSGVMPDRHLFFSRVTIDDFTLDELHKFLENTCKKLKKDLENKIKQPIKAISPQEQKDSYHDEINQLINNIDALEYFMSNTDSTVTIGKRINATMHHCSERKPGELVLRIFKKMIFELDDQLLPAVIEDKGKDAKASPESKKR